MKQLALALVLVCAAGIAGASEHRMKVGEVSLSNNGSTDQQFIELWDTAPGGESFPGTTYQVTIYDTDGVAVGTVVIGGIPTTNRRLLSTAMLDAAEGVDADTELTVALPAVGSACFESAVDTPIHCLNWGCPNVPKSGANGSSEGDAPGDDESLNINEGETGDGANDPLYEIATPTPREANETGTVSTACEATGLPDGGTTGDVDSGPTNDTVDGGGGTDDPDDGGCCSVTGHNQIPLIPALFIALCLLRRRPRRRRRS